MKFNTTTKLTLALGALLLFGAVSATADDRGRGYGWGNHGRGYGRNNFVARGYVGPGPRFVAPPRGFSGGFSVGRFYPGRGYFYGNRFWARPYYGVGVGIPFGYGYRTPRGCGYVDGFGQFFPAPCF